MKELLCIGKLFGVGKIIQDGKISGDIGFNIEKIKKAEKEDKGVIDLGTLRNHLKKIPQDESNKAFYKHVRLLRNKEIARELEKMLLEKASKKKIGEFIKKLKQG